MDASVRCFLWLNTTGGERYSRGIIEPPREWLASALPPGKRRENMMVRCLMLVAVCLGLACGGVACAPPRLGPTAGSGYVFSVQVSDSIVWRGPVNLAVAARFPKVAEVLVAVQDTQGRPVD